MGEDVAFPSCALAVPIFQVLPMEHLSELAPLLHHKRFPKGDTVQQHGESIEHLVVVAHGRLNLVHISGSGREQVVRTLGPGEFVGEMALFTPTRAQGDLIAAEDSTVCLVPRHAVQSLMKRHPEMAHRLIESLAERLAAMDQMVADLGLRDVGQRLAAELLRLAEAQRAAEDPPGPGTTRRANRDGVGAKVELSIPWAEMATRLGTTPESLSLRLNALATQGIIRQEGARTIVIPALDRLRQVAEG